MVDLASPRARRGVTVAAQPRTCTGVPPCGPATPRCLLWLGDEAGTRRRLSDRRW